MYLCFIADVLIAAKEERNRNICLLLIITMQSYLSLDYFMVLEDMKLHSFHIPTSRNCLHAVIRDIANNYSITLVRIEALTRASDLELNVFDEITCKLGNSSYRTGMIMELDSQLIYLPVTGCIFRFCSLCLR